MAPRPDCGSRPARPGAVLRIRRLAARTHRLRPVARSVRPLCRSQAPDTGNDRAHRNPISFARRTHRGHKRLALSEQIDAEPANDTIHAALKEGCEPRARSPAAAPLNAAETTGKICYVFIVRSAEFGLAPGSQLSPPLWGVGQVVRIPRPTP